MTVPEVNPSASPAEFGNAPDDPAVVALKRLHVPSIALIALAGLVSVLGLFVLPLVVATLFLMQLNTEESPLERWLTIPYFIASYPILVGAWSMRQGRRYRLAYGSAILSCIPFLSPFVFLGIPFGIWALIVLHRRDVKEAFARKAGSMSTPAQPGG